MVGIYAKANIQDRIFAILSIKIIFSTLSSWLDLAKVY